MSPVPVSPSNQIIMKSIIDVTRSNGSAKGFVLGEVLPTTVLERMADNKYILALKNLRILVTSEIPLNTNEKLMVKVNNLQPQIILNIVTQENQSGETRINEIIRQWRTNPESLLQVVNKVAEFTKLLQTNDLPLKLSKNDMEKLIKLFDNIIFSPRNKNNPLFLKEFVSKTGLLLENTLKQIVDQASRGMKQKPLEDNLKTLLLKLSFTAQEALKDNAKIDSQLMTKLSNINSFTQEALITIETKQVINTFFQDNDKGMLLQVPFALADGFSLADIFISPEGKNEQGRKEFSSCSVAIFLNLDILGEIMINAGIREGDFNCVIKCSNDQTEEMINDKIDDLRTALSAIGYRINYLDCIKEEELTRKHEEFLEGKFSPALDLVNYFA